MSISDLIVVMKDGVVQQIGAPQTVYDDPKNLFVAKFLGTPPISVFTGSVKDGSLYIGQSRVCGFDCSDREVYIATRPEGYVPAAEGVLECELKGVEVMGRDISIVLTHPACLSGSFRAIIGADSGINVGAQSIGFNIKPSKLFVFDRQTEERIYSEDARRDDGEE